jgi:lysophospholipase L1-like esterase
MPFPPANRTLADLYNRDEAPQKSESETISGAWDFTGGLTKNGADATSLGATLTLNTNAQRTARTPANGEIVYTTDTHGFYVGDGSTAGGVASPTGLTTEQMIRMGFIKPRHRNWLAALGYAIRSGGNVPTSVAVGNSIVQGSGASVNGNRWLDQLGSKLQTYSGVSGSWTPSNRGVGSTTVANPVSYLADSCNSTNALPLRGKFWNQGWKVTYLMSLRNDVASLTLADFSLLTRIAVLQCKRHDMDAVVVSEPPKIDGTTGAVLDTQGNFGDWYDAQRQIASSEGATYVDVWAYFMWLKNNGVDLRPTMNVDGVHPNDVGHALIASLTFAAMTSPSDVQSLVWDRPVTDGRVAAIISTVATSGVSLSNIGTGTGALSTSTTARALDRTEGTPQAYVLAATNTVDFYVPLSGAKGVIIGFLADNANLGTATLLYNFSQTVASGVTAYDPITRESCKYYSFAGINSALGDMSAAKLRITATG